MKHISPQIWLPYIQKIKDKLKSDSTFVEICHKYNMELEDIDLAPIKFGDIDVSARTDKGVITLNWNLLEKENQKQISMYILHEWGHLCQQATRPTQSADDGDYLSNKDEQEAFSYQLKFIDEHFGEAAANKYVNQVLDHHDEKGKERENKKDILMEKVESFHNLCLVKVADKVSDLKEKYPAFVDGISFLAENDPTSNKKYLSYAVRQLISGQALQNEIADVINLFHKYHARLENKNIDSWNFTELRNKLFELRESKSKRQEKYDIKTSGAETVYEDEQCKVLLVKSKAAACFYGAGTKWCITMSGEDYYEDYKSKNYIFFFILRKDLLQDNSNYKIALAYSRDKENNINGLQMFDANDDQVDISKLNDLKSIYRIFSLTETIASKQSKSPLAKFVEREISFDDLDKSEREGAIFKAIENQIKIPEEFIYQAFEKSKRYEYEYIWPMLNLAKYKYLPSDLFEQVYNFNCTDDHWNYEKMSKLLGNSSTPSKIIEDIFLKYKGTGYELLFSKMIEHPNSNLSILNDLFNISPLILTQEMRCKILEHPNMTDETRIKLISKKPGLIKDYIGYLFGRNKLIHKSVIDLALNIPSVKFRKEILYNVSNYLEHPQSSYILKQALNDPNEDVVAAARWVLKEKGYKGK